MSKKVIGQCSLMIHISRVPLPSFNLKEVCFKQKAWLLRAFSTPCIQLQASFWFELVLILTELCHIVDPVESHAHKSCTCTRCSITMDTHMSSAHICAPLPHQTSLIERKFKDKIKTSSTVTRAENQREALPSMQAFVTAWITYLWGWPCVSG